MGTNTAVGIPLALDNPEVFVPTPWESYTYDANDLAEFVEALETEACPDGSDRVTVQICGFLKTHCKSTN